MGFDPVTLTAMALAGTAVTAVGKLEEGDAKAKSAAYQAQVLRNNELIDQQNEKWAIQAGGVREAAQGMRTRANVSNLVARQGSSGVDVNTGSSRSVTDAASALGALDTLTIRSNTAREAYGYEVAAASDEAKSNLATMESSHAREAGEIGALSSLISGASSAFGNYAKWQNLGG